MEADLAVGGGGHSQDPSLWLGLFPFPLMRPIEVTSSPNTLGRSGGTS